MHERANESQETLKNISAAFEQFRLPEYQQAISALCRGQRNRFALGGVEFVVSEGSQYIHIIFGRRNSPKLSSDFGVSSATIAEAAINAGISEEEIAVMLRRVEDMVSKLEKLENE